MWLHLWLVKLFVYVWSSTQSFHAEVVVYNKLVWVCLLKMVARSFIFWGLNHNNQLKAKKKNPTNKQRHIKMLLFHHLLLIVYTELSSCLLPVTDIVHESKFAHCRKQKKEINKIWGWRFTVRFKVLEMLLIDQPFKEGQISVLIWELSPLPLKYRKKKGLKIAALFDVMLSSRPPGPQSQLDIFQHVTAKDVRIVSKHLNYCRETPFWT